MTDDRINKIDWYFKIAKDVALRSPCISRRRFGAIIVKDDAIIATGYAGTMRGAKNCGVDFPCLKDLYNEQPNISYNFCSSIHAEMNAIINAGRLGVSVIGAIMYVTEINGKSDCPCYLCRRFIVQSGISTVIDGNNKKDAKYYDVQRDFVRMENESMQEKLDNKPKEEFVFKKEDIDACITDGNEYKLVGIDWKNIPTLKELENSKFKLTTDSCIDVGCDSCDGCSEQPKKPVKNVGQG
jgi:dCMP deaminase